MGSDERDDRSAAPLPPHERTWRHPSEMGSWQHEITSRAQTPPPLSRRTTTIVAILSAACSLSIIAIAIPRGARTSSDNAEATPATQTVEVLAETRRKIAHALVHLGSTKSPGLAFSIDGTSVVLSSTELLASTNESVVPVTADNGRSGSAVVVTRDTESGLVILKPNDQATSFATNSLVSAGIDATTIEELMLLDPASSAVENAKRGIALSGNGRLIPLDTREQLSGLVVVSDTRGSIVGVALDRNHTAWLIPLDVLSELISRATGE